jgi:hypothetical protein
MPTKIRTDPRAVKPLNKILQEKQDEVWESIRGLWKNRKMNPVTYQRKLRGAADRRLS